jgi:hypothetical protein
MVVGIMKVRTWRGVSRLGVVLVAAGALAASCGSLGSVPDPANVGTPGNMVPSHMHRDGRVRVTVPVSGNPCNSADSAWNGHKCVSD